MFVSEKSPGEIPFAKARPLAPKITKLSQAIRIGSLTVREQRGWRGCALGTAAAAVGISPHTDPISMMAKLGLMFDLEMPFLYGISCAHFGGLSREEIATRLEANGK